MTRWQPTLRTIGIAATATATLTALTACSTDGQSTSDNAAASSAAQPSVDVSALDTGPYPTEPRSEFGRATDDQIVQVEGQRMAQFIVVPFEVDRDITNGKLPTSAISSRQNLTVVLGEGTADIPANDELLYGFTTTAATPDSTIREGTSRSLSSMVLRYMTPQAAEDAARQLAQQVASNSNATVTTLPGLPGTHVIRDSGTDGTERLITFTPHDTYVIYEWYQTTTEQQELLEPTVRKAISLQTALIDQFPATPTKDEAAARGITGPTRPIVDQDHVLIYALPYTDEEMSGGKTGLTPQSMRAVYGPRGMAHFSSDPVGTFNSLNDAGSTANAVERSVVYRAATPEQATTLMKSYAANATGEGIDSPPGLPSAVCSTTNTTYTCWVHNDRYVGEIHSDNQQDAYQQASAQYVLFTKADQNDS
ncbi:DUF7373 family lipoprotein [Gordonia mangrovi]|uniref:DUF7373 family lipoprotein n=1 Tax=Gordonia mangrovi TaxID=2665643 RepID=UPI001F170E65|nr:hypothetical protein [Gordonia mangrovi]UVF80159.1 hypothetical protein NWF22_10185 [Gordonia mangrovi]